jgi:hypothetical protein
VVHCATNRKVAGSIPEGPQRLGVDSTSSRNEYQGSSLSGKGVRCAGLTTLPLSRNSGSLSLLEPYESVQGQLYFLLHCIATNTEHVKTKQLRMQVVFCSVPTNGSPDCVNSIMARPWSRPSSAHRTCKALNVHTAQMIISHHHHHLALQPYVSLGLFRYSPPLVSILSFPSPSFNPHLS